MRVLWLLEELGVEYAVERYQRDPKTMRAPPALRAIHPLGKSPVVTDGNDVLVESAVIIDSLIDRYGGGRLRPIPGSMAYERYRYWLHYAEGSLMPNLLLKLVFMKLPGGVPALIRPLIRTVAQKAAAVVVDPQIDLHTSFIESELATNLYFAGDELSGADIQMSYPLEVVRSRGTLGPSSVAFLQRIHERPAYKRARARVGEET